MELTHMISGRKVHMPLGPLANRQGRVIGSNEMGGIGLLKATDPEVFSENI